MPAWARYTTVDGHVFTLHDVQAQVGDLASILVDSRDWAAPVIDQGRIGTAAAVVLLIALYLTLAAIAGYVAGKP